MTTLPGHITVGFDGSPLSELAVCRALRMLSQTTFGEVNVVTVVEDLGPSVRMPDGRILNRWAASDSLHHTIASILKVEQLDNLGSQVVTHLRDGNPARALVDLAYRYHSDLIIVGTRGNGTRNMTRVGETAQGVLDLSEIPVHIESANLRLQKPPAPSALRLAYVFGGPGVKRTHFGTFGNRSASA